MTQTRHPIIDSIHTSRCFSKSADRCKREGAGDIGREEQRPVGGWTGVLPPVPSRSAAGGAQRGWRGEGRRFSGRSGQRRRKRPYNSLGLTWIGNRSNGPKVRGDFGLWKWCQNMVVPECVNRQKEFHCAVACVTNSPTERIHVLQRYCLTQWVTSHFCALHKITCDSDCGNGCNGVSASIVVCLLCWFVKRREHYI